jgi:AraC-like DNA-binding protein
LSDGEAAIIAERLAALADDGSTMFDPDLDITKLAKRLRLPAYRLSNYFNTRHGSSFPSWLNGIRVERARRLLLAEDRSILQIAEESGFGSKAAFNVQFKRIVGMSPSEYRRANAISPGRD